MVVKGIENIEMRGVDNLDKSNKKNKKKFIGQKFINKLQRNLRIAENEADIGRAYIEEFKRYDSKIESCSPHFTDGILDFDDFHTLLEFKYDKNYKNLYIRCESLVQAIFYYVKFKSMDPKRIPSIIFIADKDECFFINTHIIEKYTKKHDIDWEKTKPSISATTYPEFCRELEKDENLKLTFPLKVTGDLFNFGDIIDMIKEIKDSISLSPNIKLRPDKKDESTGKYIRGNLKSAYAIFQDSILNYQDVKSNNLLTEQQFMKKGVDFFFDCITDNSTGVLNNIVKNRGRDLGVNPHLFNSFFNLFSQRNYTLKEIEELVSNKDSIIEEMERRITGAFFTPSIIIDKAYELTDNQFGGIEWRNKCIVWDCASGTNNLTVGRGLKNLFSSTLNQGDIDTVNDMGYNGRNFMFDFLKDDFKRLETEANGLYLYLEDKKTLFNRKPLIFFINPPWGTSSSGMGNDHKSGCATSNENIVHKMMVRENMGGCCEQLYAQFLYNILWIKRNYHISDVRICIFSKPLFLSGQSFNNFRTEFYKDFEFKDGMLFPANHFRDVNGNWGASFTIWESKTTVDPTEMSLASHIKKEDKELDYIIDGKVLKLQVPDIEYYG